MKWHYDFGKVRNPKSKNKGYLSFLVIYDLPDSQSQAPCMKRPNNLLKNTTWTPLKKSYNEE